MPTTEIVGEGMLVYSGALAWLVLLPIWGLLMSRYLGRLQLGVQ